MVAPTKRATLKANNKNAKTERVTMSNTGRGRLQLDTHRLSQSRTGKQNRMATTHNQPYELKALIAAKSVKVSAPPKKAWKKCFIWPKSSK